MSERNDRGIFWFQLPDKDKIKAFFWWLVVVHSVFSIFYGGANRLCARSDRGIELYLDIELSVPFIPEMIYFYVSVMPLYCLPLFRVSLHELEMVYQRILLAIVISGAVFYIMPTTAAYSRPELATSYSLFFQYLYGIDNPCNLFPSLHISYSTILIPALLKDSPKWVRLVLVCWLLLIYVSVIVTYQHHLVDIPGGLVVTWVCHRLIRP